MNISGSAAHSDLVASAWQLLSECASRNSPVWAGQEGWTLTIERTKPASESTSAKEADVRADERRKCWAEINAMIISGPMPGNGVDPSAQRNGLIMAANQLLRD